MITKWGYLAQLMDSFVVRSVSTWYQCWKNKRPAKMVPTQNHITTASDAKDNKQREGARKNLTNAHETWAYQSRWLTMKPTTAGSG